MLGARDWHNILALRQDPCQSKLTWRDVLLGRYLLITVQEEEDDGFFFSSPSKREYRARTEKCHDPKVAWSETTLPCMNSASCLCACVQLECRLNSREARWEGVRTIFYGNSVIPVFEPLDAKLA